MIRVALIMLAGGIGTGARYGVSTWAARFTGFSYGTLIVNSAGSFLIGAVMTYALAKDVSDDVRTVLVTGFLGGFTTYSAFSYETVNALRQGAPGLAATNFLLTTLACFCACGLGIFLAHLLVAQRV